MVANVHSLPSWIDFAAVLSGSNLLFLFYAKFVSYQYPLFCSSDFFFRSILAIGFYSIMFSMGEKIKKELFVLHTTNAKTKKQLMKIFNISGPAIIVSKDGGILMCNENFECMLSERMGVNKTPQNINKFIQNDSPA